VIVKLIICDEGIVVKMHLNFILELIHICVCVQLWHIILV